MKRSLRVAVFLLATVLVGCASQTINETNYNLGVQAYKAKNYKEAAAQWSNAAKSGDVNAMNNLGYLQFNGLGIEKDQQRGISLWYAAAMRGQSESQWHLGGAYEAGTGVQQSSIEVYAWYRCAVESASRQSENGDSTEQQIANDARESLVKLTDNLGQDELAGARALAQKYIAQFAGNGL